MSTGAIIAIVVVVLIVLALIAVLMPRMRAKSRERQLVRERGSRRRCASRAGFRTQRRAADEAEQIAARERAEAELHETRARMHERGLADDELADDRARLGDERFVREPGGQREERIEER